MKRKKLCETIKIEYKPFIMGGNVDSEDQCNKIAVCYSTGKTPSEKKQKPMYLCSGCLKKFLKQSPDYKNTIKDIT